MALGELESEAALLLERVLHRLHMVSPGETVAIIGVMDGVVGSHSEGDAIGGLRARESETPAGGGRIDRVEVEVCLAIEVVKIDPAVAVEFGDLEVGVRGEEVLEGLVEGVEEGEQLRGQDVLKDRQESEQ